MTGLPISAIRKKPAIRQGPDERRADLKNAINATPWIGDWAWSLPLIVSTLVIHVCGLAFINGKVVNDLDQAMDRADFIPKFVVVIGCTSLLATILHGIEAGFGQGPLYF
jgi:hypothetical protein